jgi:hypothetical protein
VQCGCSALPRLGGSRWSSAPGQILSVGHSVRAGTSVKYNYYVAGRVYESSSGDLPHFNRARLKAGNKISVRFKRMGHPAKTPFVNSALFDLSNNEYPGRAGMSAYTVRTMEKLQAFQAAAREGGFVQMEESEEGTVLWFRKEASETATETHQRMCMDSLTNSVTVYWASVSGKIDSKTFRSVATLQEWIALRPVH